MRVKVLSFSALPQSFALEQCFDLFYIIFCWTFLEFRNWNSPKNDKMASRTDRKPCVSLRSWRYCLGARFKFWWRSGVPKKGSRDEVVGISRGFAARDGSAVKSCSTILQRLRRQISLDYYTIPPATQANCAFPYSLGGGQVFVKSSVRSAMWHSFSRAPISNLFWYYYRWFITSLALEKCKKECNML